MSAYLKLIGAYQPDNHEQRLRNCLWCDVQFTDVTKRFTFRTCSSECAYAYGTAKRKTNGSYERTEEQNRRTGISVRKTYEEQDISSKISASLTIAFENGLGQRQSEGHARSRAAGNKHWTQTDEGRKRLSQPRKSHSNSKKSSKTKQVNAKLTKLQEQGEIEPGFRYTNQARLNMSLGQQRRLRSKRETHHTSAKGGFRKDLQQYFRSNWEANFARIMNLLGKQWEYEPQSFQLTETLSYTPDFRVDGEFYELKGRMTERCEKQITLFREQNLNVVLHVIEIKQYEQYRKKYKHLIATWEGK